MSDQTIFEKSNVSQSVTEPMLSRSTVYIQDQNNGQYSGGQIQLDSASLSNSGKYAAYSDAYFEIPLVVRLTATSANAKVDAIRQLESSFAVGLKSGYYNIFHSYSVEYNNRSVVSLTPYSNIYTSFRMLTKMSQDDVAKYGSLLGFFPDSAVSVNYGSATLPSSLGHGSLNNKSLPGLSPSLQSWNTALSQLANEGFYKRQVQTTAFNPAQAPASAFTSASNATAIGMNFFQRGSGADIDSKWWYIMATIRLRDMSDFFQQLPLLKGSFLKFQLNTNTAVHSLKLTVAGGALTDFESVQNNITGGSTPLLISSAEPNGAGFGQIADTCVALGNGVYEFECAISIARDTKYNHPNPFLATTRLYVPLYTLNPTAEAQYLMLNKSKTVLYTDIYQYQVDVSTSGGIGQFNSLLTNGIVGIKNVIIVPFVGAASNPTATGSAFVAPYGSPFASEPSTTSPYIAINNFNLQVSGVNVYSSNEVYDFSNFKDELSQVNSIMGGQVDGLSSGLIGFHEFQTNARYMVIDCSRRLPAEDFVAKSIQITGTVQSSFANCSLMVYVEQQKQLVLDMSTGAIEA